MRSLFKKILSPFWRLVFLLVVIPMLEVFFLIHFLGEWLTLLSMFLSGLLGVFLAYREGWRYWHEMNQRLDRGESSAQPALHGVLIIMGALFMILPGLMTSLFGIFLLFPMTRSLVMSYLVLRFEAHRHQARRGNTPRGDTPHSPEIIDI